MKEFLKKNGARALILIIISCAFLWYGRCKAGFFIDEIYTYGLSNSHFAPYLLDNTDGPMEDEILSREELISYVTVDEGEELDFASVYSNQEADVHPPLYYFFFNAFSSLFGRSFSKWTGLCLNWIFLLGSLLLLSRLCRELELGNLQEYAVLLMYGLSSAGISCAVLIRMYMLLSLETLLLSLFALRLIRSGEMKNALLSGLAILSGMLTQYYFVFYAFFLSLLVCILLLKEKKLKLCSVFAASALGGVLLAVIAFPASLKHIFVGNGQVVSAGNALENLSDFLSSASDTKSQQREIESITVLGASTMTKAVNLTRVFQIGNL